MDVINYSKIKKLEGEAAQQNQENDTRFNDLEDDLTQHKLDYMPHRFQDIKNNKKYKFGFQINEEGNPQIIFEEVI